MGVAAPRAFKTEVHCAETETKIGKEPQRPARLGCVLAAPRTWTWPRTWTAEWKCRPTCKAVITGKQKITCSPAGNGIRKAARPQIERIAAIC